jgi:hypothetical protein
MYIYMQNESHIFWAKFYKTNSFRCLTRKHGDFHLDIDTLLNFFSKTLITSNLDMKDPKFLKDMNSNGFQDCIII